MHRRFPPFPPSPTGPRRAPCPQASSPRSRQPPCGPGRARTRRFYGSKTGYPLAGRLADNTALESEFLTEARCTEAAYAVLVELTGETI